MFDLKNNIGNDFYEYINDNKYGKVYIILPNPEKGFNVGYSLFIPNGCQIDTTMLVHCCNTGGAGIKDGKLDSSRRAIHLDEANEAAKISSLGGHLNYGYDLKIPVLTPLIPRIQGYYTQFLGSKVYHNDISELKKDNEHRSEEDRLSDEEIKHIQEVCNNLPDQLAHIIVDSKDVLSKMGIHIDDKVIIEGYSAGSKFASGFTATHRELVKGCICGGNSGISILPVSEYDGEKLKFPLGVADVPDFDFKEFSRIPQYFYLGLSDYNDPALVNEQFQPLYRDCYTSEEVAFINNKLGSNVQERFDKLSDIYKQYGLNATFNKFKGDHKTVNNPDGPAYPMVKDFINNIISQEKSNKEESQRIFDYRTKSEVDIYDQIKYKNQIIKDQKKQYLMNKSKVLVRKLPTTSLQVNSSNSNKGYINVIMISLIISFVLIVLFIIIYICVWR